MHVAALAATPDGDAIVMSCVRFLIGSRCQVIVAGARRALRRPPHDCLHPILRHLPLLEAVTRSGRVLAVET